MSINFQNQNLQTFSIIFVIVLALIGGAKWRHGEIESGLGFFLTFPVIVVSSGLAFTSVHSNVKDYSLKIFLVSMFIFFVVMCSFPA